ncbi:FMN-binding negative transcriptional regulator [Ideonella sp. 4Y11]|uniref:FMN-binding negative transcriptional regulator n=1 Tax=Ideonella aquatica TaxID=2824119 RepID=A0A940YLE7_9BURK|nr:FMN-binding negative transcriptional regulator [Ideonella aquatica]MBQ0960019.1 FMN-binding negative transcriptional regulator [Ideonella aquatica]
MYVPRLHAMPERADALALMRDHPLATWITAAGGELQAHHLPTLLEPDHGPHGRLQAHVSRANPLWRALGDGSPALVVFRGPQAYITPGWYPGKSEHGRVVPTWNYVAVHVHGTARAVDDPAALRDLLDRLSARHEATQPRPWAPADAPADYLAGLLRGIVGIELVIDRLEARRKASQDEDLADRHGTVAGLRTQPGDDAQAMADIVQRTLD